MRRASGSFRVGRELRMYALLDAARDPAVLDLLNTWRPEHTSLFSDHSPAALLTVAPYLARLGPQTLFADTLTRDGWGRDWVVCLESRASLAALKAHFRKFLLVKDHEDRRLYFRFYDPRILRAYLPTLNDDEAREFFGPIDAFLCPTDRRETLLEFRLITELAAAACA